MKPIISELNIEKYRGINRLKLNDLSRINVLAGVNNSGKTSVLEVIGLLSAPLDRTNFQRWATMRVPKDKTLKEKLVSYITALFSRLETDSHQYLPISFNACVANSCFAESTIEIIYNAEMNKELNSIGEEVDCLQISAEYTETVLKLNFFSPAKDTAKFRFKNNSTFRQTKGVKTLFQTDFIFVGSNFYKDCVHHVSKSMLNEQKSELLSVIQSFDPDIIDIMLNNDDILLHSRQSGVLPLFTYGSGLQKAVLLAASLMGVKDNIILIDEIDNAINISAFKEVFSWFINACRELNVQAFVTTHSLEAIDAILEATEDDAENGLEDDIRIITLRKTPKSHKSVALIRTGEEARSDRDRFEMELRV